MASSSFPSSDASTKEEEVQRTLGRESLAVVDKKTIRKKEISKRIPVNRFPTYICKVSELGVRVVIYSLRCDIHQPMYHMKYGLKIVN